MAKEKKKENRPKHPDLKAHHFQWFSEEDFKGGYVDLLMSMQRSFSSCASEMEGMDADALEEHLEDTKESMEEEQDGDLRDEKCYDMVVDHLRDGWSETILETGDFLREIYLLKDYIFSYSEIKDVFSVILEAVGAVQLFCDLGDELLQEWHDTFERIEDKAEQNEVAYYEAECFAENVGGAGIRIKLEEAAAKLRAYCHLRADDTVSVDQIARSLQEREIDDLLSKDVATAILEAMGTRKLKRMQIVALTGYQDGGHVASNLRKLKKLGMLRHHRPLYWINPEYYKRLGICPDKDGQ